MRVARRVGRGPCGGLLQVTKMNPAHDPSAAVAAAIQTPALLLVVPLLAYVAATAPWRRFATDRDAHLFWGSATAIALLWNFGPQPFEAAPGLHVLGATVACAMFGWRHALLLMTIGIALQRFASDGDWGTFPATVLLGAAVPVLLAHVVLSLVRRAPPTIVPAVLVAAGFGAGALTMVSVSAGLWVFGGLPMFRDGVEVAALTVHLAILEANFTAMVLTLIVVNRPEWLTPEVARPKPGRGR
jgi:uncharacterized membrane protein